MKKRYVIKRPRLVRLGSVSSLTKGANTSDIELVGHPKA